MKTLQFIAVICLLASVLRTTSGLASIWQHKTCLKFCRPARNNCMNGCICTAFRFFNGFGACLNESLQIPWMFRPRPSTLAE
uniref:Mucin n=1 Tax=Rhipicephalus appendiculatus TaxID=34631 RepID=A0A131YSV4_RHIAP